MLIAKDKIWILGKLPSYNCQHPLVAITMLISSMAYASNLIHFSFFFNVVFSSKHVFPQSLITRLIAHLRRPAVG